MNSKEKKKKEIENICRLSEEKNMVTRKEIRILLKIRIQDQDQEKTVNYKTQISYRLCNEKNENNKKKS